MRKIISAMAAIGLTVASAQAQCWSGRAIAAAKVRDMETMLMVAALRCRGEIDILTNYNAFVVSSRKPLTQVNDMLRAHFSADIGAKAGLNAYDGYVTAIANRYGAGAAGLDCTDMGSIVEAALAEGATFEALSELADRAGIVPRLDGATCEPPVVLAALQP